VPTLVGRQLRRLSKLLKLHLICPVCGCQRACRGTGPRRLDACPVFEPATKFKTFPPRPGWLLHRHGRPPEGRDSALLVGLIGLEPMTLRLSSACSNQLSYRPMRGLMAQGLIVDRTVINHQLSTINSIGKMEARGLEPLTSSLQSWRSTN
jgi:hypothetical protein